MITTLILNLLYYVVWLITSPLRLLADATANANVTSAISTASGYISPLNAVLPLGTILAILVAFFAIETGVFVWKGINWLIRKIPTIS